MKIQIRILLVTLGFASAMNPTSSNAQAGSSGNGGSPFETAEFTGLNAEHLQSWYAVKQDLKAGFLINRHHDFELSEAAKEDFKTKVVSMIDRAKVEFVAHEVIVNGVKRVCRNYLALSGEGMIECDQNAYVAAMQKSSSEDQYRFIAHEYFSVAGLEPNQYGVSDYPFSSKVAKSLQSVFVKKWAVSDSEVTVPAVVCSISSSGSLLSIARSVDIEFYENEAFITFTENSSIHSIQDFIKAVNGRRFNEGYHSVVQRLKSGYKNKTFLTFDPSDDEIFMRGAVKSLNVPFDFKGVTKLGEVYGDFSAYLNGSLRIWDAFNCSAVKRKKSEIPQMVGDQLATDNLSTLELQNALVDRSLNWLKRTSKLIRHPNANYK